MVRWIHVKIVLNVEKAWNFAQMRLLSCRPRIDLGAFRKFPPFVCVPMLLLENKVFLLKGKILENELLAFKKQK